VNETSGPCVYLMEFLHSWTGLKDEYEVSEGGASTNRPADLATRNSTNACVMDDTSGTRTELCRRGDHNPNTEQGNVRGMDCYSWLKKVMNEAGHTEFRAPTARIVEPTSAPTLQFVYLTIQRVRQIDDPDPGPFQSAADYSARMKMGGSWFAASRTIEDAADTFPNWLYGFAFSSDTRDTCDISPVRGKKVLDIRYNTASGQITGDIVGVLDTSITTAGLGESDRAEITFMITSR
jgi:hypothetical protein